MVTLNVSRETIPTKSSFSFIGLPCGRLRRIQGSCRGRGKATKNSISSLIRSFPSRRLSRDQSTRLGKRARQRDGIVDRAAQDVFFTVFPLLPSLLRQNVSRETTSPLWGSFHVQLRGCIVDTLISLLQGGHGGHLFQLIALRSTITPTARVKI